MHRATSICAVFFVSSVSAAVFGYYPVSLCPANGSSWAGKALNNQEACPSPLVPASQSLSVANFRLAQTNLDPYVLRSNTYALAILRHASIISATVDFDIRDATGQMIVPRTTVNLLRSPTALFSGRRSGDHLSPTVLPPTMLDNTAALPTAALPKRNTKKAGRGSRKEKGKVLQSEPPALIDLFGDIDPEMAPPVKKDPSRGRRKGKGIGGGGRYGGGTGGFRSSRNTKSYGYSNAAMNSRYAPYSYTQTSYGYSGRSALYAGTPIFIYMGASRGGSHGHYHSCARFSGAQLSSCEQQYSSCRSEGNGTLCSSKVSALLVRDDLMMATVNLLTTVFPLNVTFHGVAITFKDGTPKPAEWQHLMVITFSEVDFDDENDPDMELWVFCLLMSIGGVALCTAAFCCWCICCDKKCCCLGRSCRKCYKRNTAYADDTGIEQRSISKEFDDLEGQHSHAPVHGVPVSQGHVEAPMLAMAAPQKPPPLTVIELKP